MIKKVNKTQSATIALYFQRYLIFFIIVLFSFTYSFIGIVKYNHFQTGLDLAIYVQQYYFYLHARLPHVTLWPTLGDLVWADHMSPSLILLTPFYYFWHDPRVLLIVQPFIYLSGAFAVWDIAKKRTGSLFFAYSLALVFCLFFGVQFPLTFDFHEATMGAATIAWVLWALDKQKWISFAIFSVIGMGFKEDMPLYIFAIGIYLIIARINWKVGLLSSLFSLSYFLLITQILMPSFHHIGVKTESTSFFSFNPLYLYKTFFDSPIKIQTIFLCFSSFLFVPFLSGWFILIAFAHFLINFADPHFPGRWGIYLHYRGYVAGILSFGFIYGYERLEKWLPKVFTRQTGKISVSCLLLLMGIFMDIALHLPLNILVKKQFYYTEQWIRDNNTVINKLPAEGVLLTQNSLAPQVAFRQYVYYFPEHLYDAKYILLDLHKDRMHESINFWLSDYFRYHEVNPTLYRVKGNESNVQALVSYLIQNKQFTVIVQAGDTELLKRTGIIR